MRDSVLLLGRRAWARDCDFSEGSLFGFGLQGVRGEECHISSGQPWPFGRKRSQVLRFLVGSVA